nr:dienelactone hydrolase family protein [Clostridium sp.]
PVSLIFPAEEISFDVKKLVITLKKWNIDVHILRGKHGFADTFSKNYCTQSFEEAEILVDNFLRKTNYVFP